MKNDQISNSQIGSPVQATTSDIPILVNHHRWMFEEIWTFRKWELSKQKLEDMDEAYRLKLESDLDCGICKAWLIKGKEKVLASGAISVASFVPLPTDSSCNVAYLHSIYTEIDHRGKGLAGKIVTAAIDYCKEQGVNRIFLHASEAGRRVYEKIGFQSANNVMNFTWI